MKRKIGVSTVSALVGSALLCGCSVESDGAAGRGGIASHYPGAGFPGAGRGSAGAGLAIGPDTVTCDRRGASPVAPFAPSRDAVAQRICLFADDPDPAATVEWIVDSAPASSDLVHVRLTFNPAFADNTYGANAIGWPEKGAKPHAGAKPPKAPNDPLAPLPAQPPDRKKPGEPMGGEAKAPHTFRDLVGSDHAEFKLTDGSGRLVMQFKADYLSESTGVVSGYRSLGVRGGDGKMIVGDAEDIVQVSTSLERNLNLCGYEEYLVDSPATDAAYTPNPATPLWDYRIVYDVWVRAAPFAPTGFGKATVDFVHASPSKVGDSTVKVVEKPCETDRPYCETVNGCDCVVWDGSCIGRDTPPPDDNCFAPDSTCGERPPREPPGEPEACKGFNCGL